MSIIETKTGIPPCEVEYLIVEPARKYKKKRISKKWLKRYGYKQSTRKAMGYKIETHTDGSYEINNVHFESDGFNENLDTIYCVEL